MKRFALGAVSLVLLSSCGDSNVNSSQPVAAQSSETPPPKSEARANANAAIAKDYTEQLFQNPFDADAVYFLSQKDGTAKALSVLVKRDSKDGTQYSRWQFNCVDHTAQNLGVSKSLQDLDKTTNSMPSAVQRYELKSRLGAIASAVCPK
jgi:hypothetical protein